MSELIYKDKNIAVISKSPGISSQPDMSGGTDAMTELSARLASLGESGTLYPVHRLDNVVGGLLVYARNKSTAAELSAMVQSDGIGKEYFAVIDGSLEDGEYTDYLYKDTAKSRAVTAHPTDKRAKKATLMLRTLDSIETPKGRRSLIRVRLLTGRFHQIRAQLSSRGSSIVGDSKYGSRDFLSRTPALFSCTLEIKTEGESLAFTALPSLDKYPWNLFSAEKYDQNFEKVTK